VVLPPEYEDPDGDAGQQDDSYDESPPALYGAEDVLSAQDSSSALKNRGEGRTDPHPIRPITSLDDLNRLLAPEAATTTANLASLQNQGYYRA
jgi:hypothetical protein